ncbi:MAG: glycosyltransferase family 1 protein [Anaerolineae bacterium]|nr:glycosyltransferase family 1 protein [Anaerolineae bacterium]
MKIVISTFGVRGDVQPYLALAVVLQAAGHQVTLVTSDSFSEWIESYGVATHAAQFNVQAVLQSPEAQAIVRGRNYLAQIRLMRDAMRQSPEAQDVTWEAMQDADLVIQSPSGTGAMEAAAVRGIPAVFASPVPWAPTSAYPSFFLGSRRFSLGGRYNLVTHKLTDRMLWSAMGSPMTGYLRKKLGLQPWKSFGDMLAYSRSIGTPVLYGFSQHVIPRPADWDAYQHITGYWFLEEQPGWQPAQELVAFLDGGPPPVYIGFGSMSHEDAQRMTALALRALDLSDQRGVLLTGWGGLARQDAPADVLFVDDVPHTWLFPRMAAVVHHGGAGTTGAGLRAGVPNLVAPFAPNDQPAWAERVADLGVGLHLPGAKKLTADALAAAIRTALHDSEMRSRAAALGEKIRVEDGVARAIELIEGRVA